MSVKDIEGRVEVKERITIRKRGQITGEQEADVHYKITLLVHLSPLLLKRDKHLLHLDDYYLLFWLIKL